jgi:hypothetical protein
MEPAKPLFSYRPYWARRFGVSPFLPMSRQEMDALGWDSCDVILVTGDAYIDHPSFGMALVGRLLEAQGYRVGIIAQPDWHSADPFRAHGRPTLYFGVTAGNMDSMVNRYTSDRKIRSDDAYTPNAEPNKRPDRAVTVYAQRCRQAYPGTPVIIAGSHSDPWELTHPGLVLGAYAEHEFEDAVAALDGKRHPADWDGTAEYPVATVVASTTDHKIDLLENGALIAEGRLTIKGFSDRLGSHVLVLKGAHEGAKGLAWQAIGHHEQAGITLPWGQGTEESVVTRLQADAAFQGALRKRMHPGMVMVVTDNPLHPDRRSGTDFVIMTDA